MLDGRMQKLILTKYLSTVIVVGSIETDVNVSESDGVAQLTVSISMPPSGVSIEAFFYLIMNTLNGTATG